jgi:hypothetical protein
LILSTSDRRPATAIFVNDLLVTVLELKNAER